MIIYIYIYICISHPLLGDSKGTAQKIQLRAPNAKKTNTNIIKPEVVRRISKCFVERGKAYL